MPEIKIYGASDDLIEFEGYIYGEANVYAPAQVHLIAPDDTRMLINIKYDGNWLICPVFDSWTPEWSVRMGWRDEPGYDPAIFIEVPEGTTATCNGEEVT